MQNHEYTLNFLASCPQTGAEGDCTHVFAFPEGLPRILTGAARVCDQRVSCRGDRWDATGEVEFRLFFVRSGKLASCAARETFHLQGTLDREATALSASCRALPLRLRREGDEAYRAQCTLEIMLRAYAQESLTCLTDLYDPAPEQQMASLSFFRQELTLSPTIEVQEDVLLDTSLPQAGEILDLQAAFIPAECHNETGEAHITGSLATRILYSSKDEGLPVTAHFELPVSASVRHGELQEGASPQILPGPVDLSGRIYADVQGEDRLLHLSARIQCSLFDAQEEKVTLLRDAYSLDASLQLDSTSLPLPQLPRRSLLTLTQDLTCPMEGDAPALCLYALPQLRLDALKLGSDADEARGSLSAQLLCRDAENSLRVVHIAAPVTLPLPPCPEDTELEIADLTLCAEPQGNNWKLTLRVQLVCCSYPTTQETLVTAFSQSEPEPAPEWGLKLLIAASGDSLWSLARRSRVPLSALGVAPDAARESLSAGKAILVQS